MGWLQPGYTILTCPHINWGGGTLYELALEYKAWWHQCLRIRGPRCAERFAPSLQSCVYLFLNRLLQSDRPIYIYSLIVFDRWSTKMQRSNSGLASINMYVGHLGLEPTMKVPLTSVQYHQYRSKHDLVFDGFCCFLLWSAASLWRPRLPHVWSSLWEVLVRVPIQFCGKLFILMPACFAPHDFPIAFCLVVELLDLEETLCISVHSSSAAASTVRWRLPLQIPSPTESVTRMLQTVWKSILSQAFLPWFLHLVPGQLALSHHWTLCPQTWFEAKESSRPWWHSHLHCGIQWSF